MATYSGKDVGLLLVQGYNLQTFANAMDQVHRESVLEDVTVFGQQDQTFGYAGLRKASWGIKGFYDDGALASNAAGLGMLATGPGAGLLGLAGNTQGQNAILFAGIIEKNYDRDVKVGMFHHLAAGWSCSGEVDEGIIHAPLAAQTANAHGASINNSGGATGFGAALVLQVTALALGTATNLVIKLQDSADNVTFADVSGGTFTAVTAAPFAQRLVVSGTVRQYTQIAWNWTSGPGGGSSATFAVGFFRGTAANTPK